MIMPPKYTMSIYKSILMNTSLFQMLRKKIWIINMILLIYFMKHMITIFGLKMKNWLMQFKIKKNLELSDMPLLEGVEEVKEGKLQTNY